MELKTFKVKFKGTAHISNTQIPVECTMDIPAMSESDAKNIAFTLAKNAYLTWSFDIV